MKIAKVYSHLNGLEYLLVHKNALWKEIQEVIRAVDARACRTKISKEKRMAGDALFSPPALNKAFKSRRSPEYDASGLVSTA
jgi:predicted patatin/cPLA2 family phospholipase